MRSSITRRAFLRGAILAQIARKLAPFVRFTPRRALTEAPEESDQFLSLVDQLFASGANIVGWSPDETFASWDNGATWKYYPTSDINHPTDRNRVELEGMEWTSL